MSILGDVLGAGTSALSGGLFGLAGNVATKLFGYFDAEQSARQRQAAWDHAIAMRKLDQACGPHAVQPVLVPDPLITLEESLRAEAALPPSYTWVNAVRSLVRPALTLGLTTFLAAAFFAMPQGAADKTYVVNSLVFASVTAITWWFGDRAPRRVLR